LADSKDTSQQSPLDPMPLEPKRGFKRTILFVLAMVFGVIVYAYGFDVTKVNLDEIKSETRQAQLVRVLRSLARPDLMTYERVSTPTDTAFAMPCPAGGFTPTEPDPNARHITVEPSCVEPGGKLTVRGSNFSPNARGTLVQVPPSGDLELRLADFQVDGNGDFVLVVNTRERASDQPQIIRAITRENIGTIFNPVEVSQDDNGNGVQDPTAMPAGGRYSFDIPSALPDVPGLALIDPGGDVVQFATLGEPFQATNGPAQGDTAIPLEETQTDGLHIAELTGGASGPQINLEGPADSKMSEWTVAVYNSATGEVATTVVVTDSIVKSPRISKSTTDTWERIVETVFLAFLATTLGTIIAVPLSFLAARNLMRDISVPMTKLALQLLAMPVGVGVGILAAGWARTISELLTDSVLLVILGLVVIPFLMVLAFRWALPPVEEEPPTPGERSVRALVVSIASVGGIVVLFLLASLMVTVGNWLAPRLASVDFLGSFVASLGDILNAIITLLTALATAGVLMNLAGKLGMWMKGHLPAGFIKVFRMPLAAAAGAVLAVLIGIAIGSLYQITDPLKIYWIPAAVGAAIGLALAIRAYQKEQVGIGLSIYYIARTIFNAIRSIEPLVMVIVFVVWVGLGPFAGSLALALHTVAALAKLYSEQVESIQAGPIEAVKASGATRIQTIVYAVIPQIVPPYISFTLYRWDINVRMSTIIGFAGGGGIGFLLQQNIRLLNYRAASVNMLAIAIVVASMDYLSSRIRERIV
jgi:phosphonate ABC transporter permease subunit PhnE